jgi:RimJ/RimL family protein N-acetyltransferase
MIETERLVLRRFGEADREPFATINADPRVHAWLGGPIGRTASDLTMDRANRHIDEHGFGFWAVERKTDRRLIGMIGLRHMPEDLPPAPVIEAGWRLAPDCWGQGFAAEGAGAAIAWGFAHLAADEIMAITAATNLRSQQVMRRLGMVEQPCRGFDHPLLAADHPLRRHVVFVAGRG